MRRPDATGLLRAGAWCAGLVLALATIVAMLRTGPWYDEFFTLHVTQAGQPLGNQLAHHWLADNHPPLFYGLARATAWLGSEAEPRRLLNLAFLALAAAALAGMARRIANGPAVAALAGLALAGNVNAIDKAAELRSTFLTMAAATVALAALVAFATPHRVSDRPRRDFLMLMGALALAANVHFITSVLVGAIAGAFALRLALARDWPGLRRLLAAGTLAAVPLVVTTSVQLAGIETNTRNFWIGGGWAAARWAIQTPIETTLAANWPLAVAGVVGLALLAMQALRTHKAEEPFATLLVLAGGSLAGLIVLVVLHLWRPLLIARYLLALVPVIAMILAFGAAETLKRLSGWRASALAVLIFGATLLSIWLNLQFTLHRPSWYGTGRTIATMARACPGTVVHANMDWNRPVIALPPPDNAAVMPEAYRRVARHFGFPLEPAGSRRMAVRCPTVFWTEHVAALSPALEAVARPLRAQGYALGKTRLFRIGRGWILVSVPR